MIDDIDELVAAGLAEGLSIRAIARELDVERGRVDRVAKRLAKHERALDAAQSEAENPSSLQQQIERIDGAIAAATDAGNDMRALRLAKVRATLVEQLPPVKEADPDATEWTLLTDTERSALMYLVARANHADANPWWAEYFAAIPATVDEVHPAHVPLPLPVGAPEGTRLLVP